MYVLNSLFLNPFPFNFYRKVYEHQFRAHRTKAIQPKFDENPLINSMIYSPFKHLSFHQVKTSS